MDGKIASALSVGSSTGSEPLEQQLRRASKIARLELPEDELKGLLRDAEAIFKEFSQVRGLEPPHVSGETLFVAGALREDVVEKFPDADRILGQVPKMEEGARLIKAPKSL